VYFGSVDDLKYKLSKVITFTDNCDNFAVSVYYLFVSNEKKIRMLNFNGGLEREWTFEANVNCMKLIGGPIKKECLTVGLANGNVYKLFSENPFPILLIQQSISVQMIEISSDLKRLAIVTNFN
jgi:intraflagellar transport protein 122